MIFVIGLFPNIFLTQIQGATQRVQQDFENRVPAGAPKYFEGGMKLLPRAHYTALEVSAYLCRRYGWTRAPIETFRARRPYDLVICYDVLQYLDGRAAARALANFARLCRGVLYFSALTRRDYAQNCDRERTDAAVHLRSARWYRQRLRPHFQELGLGFWARRGAPLTLWELESQ